MSHARIEYNRAYSQARRQDPERYQKYCETRQVQHAADPRKIMLMKARQRAKEFNLPFSITVDDIPIPDKCPILGTKFVVGVGKVAPTSPTLDRIIPELGYVPGNVAVISFRANAIKRDATLDEIKAVANWMENNITDAQRLITAMGSDIE